MSEFDESELSPEELEEQRIERARAKLRNYQPPTVKIAGRMFDLSNIPPLTIGNWIEIERKHKIKRDQLLLDQVPLEKKARVSHALIQQMDADVTYDDFISTCKQSTLAAIWNTISKHEIDETEIEQNPT